MNSVLLVDDDTEILAAVEVLLSPRYAIHCATSMGEAVKSLTHKAVAAVVTDYKMVGPSGLDLANFISALSPRPPVIMLSAFVDKQLALDCIRSGVFGVIEKPFKSDELFETLERALSISKPTKHIAAIEFSTDTHEVTLGNRRVKLTSTEYEILVTLYSHQDHWVSRTFLESQVWKDRSISRNLFDTHFSNLRKKLPELRDSIQALRGRGYLLKSDRKP